jgi:hypothetical protein
VSGHHRDFRPRSGCRDFLQKIVVLCSYIRICIVVLILANTTERRRAVLVGRYCTVPYPFLENILESVPFKVILQVLLGLIAIEMRIMFACNVLN